MAGETGEDSPSPKINRIVVNGLEHRPSRIIYLSSPGMSANIFLSDNLHLALCSSRDSIRLSRQRELCIVVPDIHPLLLWAISDLLVIDWEVKGSYDRLLGQRGQTDTLKREVFMGEDIYILAQIPGIDGGESYMSLRLKARDEEHELIVRTISRKEYQALSSGEVRLENELKYRGDIVSVENSGYGCRIELSEDIDHRLDDIHKVFIVRDLATHFYITSLALGFLMWGGGLEAMFYKDGWTKFEQIEYVHVPVEEFPLQRVVSLTLTTGKKVILSIVMNKERTLSIQLLNIVEQL